MKTALLSVFMDWQDAFLEMLAMTDGLDSRVSLDILFDDRKVAGWSVARYESCLIPEGTKGCSCFT